jgi:hypothetical protein
MVARLELTYDIPEGTFPNLASRIIKHLTPKEEKVSPATEIELKSVREVLSKPIEPWKFIDIRYLPWSHGGFYAKDLGFFSPKERDDIFDFQNERYFVPVYPSCLTSYDISFWGKNINNVGDYPMQVRMDGDFRGHTAGLDMLLSWHRCFQEHGRDGMVDKLIGVGKAHAGELPDYDAMLAGMPKTEEDFQQQIQEQRLKITASMLEWSVNMARFYWDFFGKPIQEAGYFPTNVRAQGPYDFELLLTPDLDTIVQFPTVPHKELAKKLFPKALDDFTPCLPGN